MERITCFLCNGLILGDLNSLSVHFRAQHRLILNRGIPGTGFICAQNGCQRSFINFYDLRKHIRNNHSLQNNQEHYNNLEVPLNEQLQENANPQEVDGINQFNVVVMEEDGNVAQEQIVNETIDDYLRHHALRMIGRSYSNGSITNSAMTNMIDEFEELLLQLQTKIKSEINLCLQNRQIIDQNLIQDINLALTFNSPFENLKKFDQQISALIETCGFIEAEEKPFDSRWDTRLNSETCSYGQIQVHETFQYIPVIRVLTLILSNAEIRQAIHSEKPSTDGILRSSVDGKYFRNHPLFQKYPHAIRIKLYYDELEIVNPLGSKTTIHKLGIFYYQIDNIPTIINSELSSIHVLIIATHEDIIKYGFYRLLQPFIKELEELEKDEGIILNFNGENYVLRATLFVLCGDGLAIHEVYNLLGPKANRFCRLCLITRESLHTGSLEKFPERTVEVYNDHIDYLKTMNFCQAAKTATGVKGECCLNQSKYFHTSRNKIFDIMHDILCGIGPMVIKLVLYEYIQNQGIFDTSYLNGKIALFNYGYTEQKNKPSPNFTDSMLNRKEHTISQKAMQTWCLLRALPFLLAEKVNHDDKHMELILYLLRIMYLIFAPEFPASLSNYLSDLTAEFIEYFSETFPAVNLINKMHHITHYAECIEWFGPLLLYWCMRFEAKHNEIKLRAANMHNFKNPPKSVSRVPQCVQSSKWGAGDVTLNRLKIPSGKTSLVQGTMSKQYLLNLGYEENDVIFKPNTVLCNGTEYRKGLFVILEVAVSVDGDEDTPIFGRIEEIILVDNLVYLLTTVFKTFDLDTHSIAYPIEITDHQQFILTSALAFYKPYDTWMKATSNKLYISLRHRIYRRSI